MRVSVPDGLGSSRIAPALPRFLERYPDMSIELSVDNRRVTPVEESVDLAIRIDRGVMTDLLSSVVAAWRTRAW